MHYRIDRRASNLWLVSLDVDKQINVWATASDLGNSIGTALSIHVRQLRMSTKLTNGVKESRVIDRDSYTRGPHGGLASQVGMLQNRPASFA